MPERDAGRFSAPYSRYAAVYDRIGQREFGERIAQATLKHVTAAGAAPRTVLDLACGTGSSAFVFAQAGMDVTGYDRSPEMIARAVETTPVPGPRPVFIVRDMRDLAEPARFDLVTSFYDALNYLLEVSELERVFRSVLAALRPGGWFVFDLNTRAKFADVWNDSCYVATDQPGLFGVYQSWFESETGRSPLVLTFFERSADGHSWQRFDEEHVERAYPLDLVSSLLEATGYVRVEVRDYQDRSPVFGGPGTERSHRVVFIARKPEGGAV